LEVAVDNLSTQREVVICSSSPDFIAAIKMEEDEVGRTCVTDSDRIGFTVVGAPAIEM
jgi:hypothetical protein